MSGFKIKGKRTFSLKAGGAVLLLLGGALVLNGCSAKSYPAEKLKESLRDICKKEYGIEELDVKIMGKTLGVYLPIKKLFATDFKEAIISGKIRNLETLFEPSPEALDKVEDVLFTISRVILSTDKPLQFYVLAVTDVEKTGLQLILTGNTDDIKRVRVWDISRNEYRKRVIHELRLNQAVIWDRPVHLFFKDLEILTADQIRQKYFEGTMTADTLQRLFFNSLLTGKPGEHKTNWEIVDMRSTSTDKSGAVVYAKVKPLQEVEGMIPKGMELEYLFLISINEDEQRISRIIPFQYKDESGKWNKITFPKELELTENIEKWKEEFPLEEVHLGFFLAQQVTRRVEAMVGADERIRNTFHEVKLNFKYHEEVKPPYFSLDLEALLRDFNNYDRRSIVLHEDMLYLLNIASREFVDVLRGYQFGDYDHLVLNIAKESTQWTLGRNELELFRRKKMELQGLLSFTNL